MLLRESLIHLFYSKPSKRRLAEVSDHFIMCVCVCACVCIWLNKIVKTRVCFVWEFLFPSLSLRYFCRLCLDRGFRITLLCALMCTPEQNKTKRPSGPTADRGSSVNRRFFTAAYLRCCNILLKCSINVLEILSALRYSRVLLKKPHCLD